MVRAITHAVSLFWATLRAESLATCNRVGEMWKWRRYVEVMWICLSPPPWPWPDPGLSQDCCPLCHASPCWLWSGDCRYNVDCSQCVFKDQNNNGICSAHSLTLIDHLPPLSLPLWSHQLSLWRFWQHFHTQEKQIIHIFLEQTPRNFSVNWR